MWILSISQSGANQRHHCHPGLTDISDYLRLFSSAHVATVFNFSLPVVLFSGTQKPGPMHKWVTVSSGCTQATTIWPATSSLSLEPVSQNSAPVRLPVVLFSGMRKPGPMHKWVTVSSGCTQGTTVWPATSSLSLEPVSQNSAPVRLAVWCTEHLLQGCPLHTTTAGVSSAWWRQRWRERFSAAGMTCSAWQPLCRKSKFPSEWPRWRRETAQGS